MLFELPKDLRDIIWYHVKQMRDEENRQMILDMEWKLYVWLYRVHQKIMERQLCNVEEDAT
jgi:hypothetical protein